jgi:hypothetical protein
MNKSNPRSLKMYYVHYNRSSGILLVKTNSEIDNQIKLILTITQEQQKEDKLHLLAPYK